MIVKKITMSKTAAPKSKAANVRAIADYIAGPNAGGDGEKVEHRGALKGAHSRILSPAGASCRCRCSRVVSLQPVSTGTGVEGRRNSFRRAAGGGRYTAEMQGEGRR